MPELP
jgi:hypothetical protein